MVDFSRREILAAGVVGAAMACGPSRLGDDSVADRTQEGTMSVGSPILLTAGCTVLPSPNTQQSLNAAALAAPHDLPMEIHEIKFSLYDATGNSCVGGSIGCDLKLGDIQITNGYVPICLFSKYRAAGILATTTAFAEEISSVSTGDAAQYVWRLPRPLFVPGGALLTPTLQHRALVNSSYAVQIDYSGYVMPLGYRPRRIEVPWVTFYAPPGMEGTTATSVSSLETDLVNYFDTPLYLQRMVGRLYTYYTATGAVSADYGSTYWGKLLSMRMDHSDGDRVIPDLTAFADVFNTERFTLEFDGTVMPARSYFQAFLELTAGTQAGELLFPMMSMIGWREVA